MIQELIPLQAADPDLHDRLGRHALEGRPMLVTDLDSAEPARARELLARWLHDPAMTVVVEPFATLLDSMLARHQVGLWDLPRPNPELPREFLDRLPQDHPECFACPCFPICEGYGAWADSCETWKGLITDLAMAARELRRIRQGLSKRNGDEDGEHPVPSGKEATRRS